MAGALQLINPGGADGLSASKFYLFGEFALDSAAVTAPKRGMPVGFSVLGNGNVMPVAESAATGYISVSASVMGWADEDFQLPPTAQNNTNPAIADFGPSTSGPNVGLYRVGVWGYGIGLPVLGDATSAALTTMGVNFGSGALSGTITSPSGASGCWTPFTVTAGGAEAEYNQVAGTNAAFANQVGQTGNITVTAGSTLATTWTGTALTSAIATGAAIWITNAGNAAGNIGLSTYITSFVSATSVRLANPALHSQAGVAALIGGTCDLWITG